MRHEDLSLVVAQQRARADGHLPAAELRGFPRGARRGRARTLG